MARGVAGGVATPAVVSCFLHHAVPAAEIAFQNKRNLCYSVPAAAELMRHVTADPRHTHLVQPSLQWTAPPIPMLPSDIAARGIGSKTMILRRRSVCHFS